MTSAPSLPRAIVTGLDWTRKYPAIAAAIASLPARQGLSEVLQFARRPQGSVPRFRFAAELMATDGSRR